MNNKVIVELVSNNQLNLINPKLEGNQTSHDHRDRFKQFTFDHCYFSISRQDLNFATQQLVNKINSNRTIKNLKFKVFLNNIIKKIFNDIGLDILKSFIEGYNTCILCYGQTGTGKTFTMMGNSNVNNYLYR